MPYVLWHVSLFSTCESGQMYVEWDSNINVVKNKAADKVTNPNNCSENDSKELSACEMRHKMPKLFGLSAASHSANGAGVLNFT